MVRIPGKMNIEDAMAEIERLRTAQERTLDIIATWANQEGISFDATQRLSEMLEVDEQTK